MGDAAVEAALSDPAEPDPSGRQEPAKPDLANVPDVKLRATLTLLRKVTREHDKVTADDVATVLATGVTRQQVEDALNVCFAFNVITRLADTFEFHVGPQSAFDTSAKMLLARGYKL